jgi:hypothetical protein
MAHLDAFEFPICLGCKPSCDEYASICQHKKSCTVATRLTINSDQFAVVKDLAMWMLKNNRVALTCRSAFAEIECSRAGCQFFHRTTVANLWAGTVELHMQCNAVGMLAHLQSIAAGRLRDPAAIGAHPKEIAPLTAQVSVVSELDESLPESSAPPPYTRE